MKSEDLSRRDGAERRKKPIRAFSMSSDFTYFPYAAYISCLFQTTKNRHSESSVSGSKTATNDVETTIEVDSTTIGSSFLRLK